MSWYSKPWLIILLYIAPTVMSVIAVFWFALPRQKKVRIANNIFVIVFQSISFSISNLPMVTG